MSDAISDRRLNPISMACCFFFFISKKELQGFYQFNKLRQPHAKFDSDLFCVVADRPDQPVVVRQEIIVESFGVWVRMTASNQVEEKQEQPRSPAKGQLAGS